VRRSEQAREAAHAAARIERDAAAMADRLAASLSPYAEQWTRDLDLVFIGRDRDAAEHDPVLARYRVDRAVAAIAPDLARALTAIAPEVALTPAQMAPQSRAVVCAAAWCAPADAKDMLAAIARAAIAALVERLATLSLAPPPSTGAGGVLRELGALGRALEA
jgi:hypothetical protein